MPSNPTETQNTQTPATSAGSQTAKTQQKASGQPGAISRRNLSSPAFLASPADFFTNPFGVMRRMHEEMDRAFAEAFGGGAGQTGTWTPAIDISERKGNLVVHAELAGVRPEDVQLEVANDTLVLSGRRERSEEHEEGGVHRRERVYGSFYRAIPLPEGADPDKARAQFNQGVLEITIPVAQRQSQTRQIPISSSGGSKPAASESSSSTGAAAAKAS